MANQKFSYKAVTVAHARKRLGECAKRMSDAEITRLLQMLRVLCDKSISSVVEREDKN